MRQTFHADPTLLIHTFPRAFDLLEFIAFRVNYHKLIPFIPSPSGLVRESPSNNLFHCSCFFLISSIVVSDKNSNLGFTCFFDNFFCIRLLNLSITKPDCTNIRYGSLHKLWLSVNGPSYASFHLRSENVGRDTSNTILLLIDGIIINALNKAQITVFITASYSYLAFLLEAAAKMAGKIIITPKAAIFLWMV